LRPVGSATDVQQAAGDGQQNRGYLVQKARSRIKGNELERFSSRGGF
jgi:hypothetical protein